MFTIGGGEMSGRELSERLDELPAIALLRGCPAELAGEVARVAADAGFTAIEYTMQRDDAADAVRAACDAVGSRALIGAGTIVSGDTLASAVGAGARFLIAPDLRLPLLMRAKDLDVLMIPGCLTPTEYTIARECGAPIVKIFPVGALGPGYIRSLLGPFPDAQLVATGGVTAEQAPAFLEAGARAVVIGADVFAPDALRDGDIDRIASNAKRAVELIRSAKR